MGATKSEEEEGEGEGKEKDALEILVSAICNALSSVHALIAAAAASPILDESRTRVWIRGGSYSVEESAPPVRRPSRWCDSTGRVRSRCCS